MSWYETVHFWFKEEFCKLDRAWFPRKKAMIQSKVPVTWNGFVQFQADSIPHLFPLANSSQHFAFLENSFSQSSASSACPLAQRSLSENQSMCSAGSWLSSIHPAGQTEAVCVTPRMQLVLDCLVEDWKRNLLKWTRRGCGWSSSHLLPCNLQSSNSFLQQLY